jgi:prepilin peptidase CpaA
MHFEITPVIWRQACFLVLALVVFVAVLIDLRQRRIPNSLVLVALTAGILFNVLGPHGPVDGGGLFTARPGALGFAGALLGALAGLAVFMPLYVLRIMGAGDVKLMAAIGSWVGAAGVLNLALFVLSMGGLLAIVIMVWTRSSRQVLFNVSMALGQFLPGSTARFDPGQTAYRMPYTVAIAGGMLAYWFWVQASGRALIQF